MLVLNKVGEVMDDFEYKFFLWQCNVVTNFNSTTQLVRNRNTGQLMVKKVMPADEFDLHNAVSKINNNHIAKVYDAIIDNNACVILEEYVQGGTVEQLVARGTFTENYAVNVARQICDGLSELHKHEITHRDITPSNIIIGNDGVVKIIDFGISRFHRNNAQHDTQVLGTEGYAAPEQFGFRQSDSKTDIYALGVLLNYMLTGCIPSEKLYHNSDVADIILKCTNFNPELRFDSIEELSSSLKRKRVKGLTFVDKFWKNIPGFRTDNMAVHIVAGVLYFLMFSFIAMLYRDNCHYDLLKIFPVTLMVMLMFFIPIAFFSDIFGFQRCVPIIGRFKKPTRRTFFRIFAIVSIFFSMPVYNNFVV